MLPCVECGERIPKPLSEQQIVRHVAALLEDIDRSIAKRFMNVFDVKNDSRNTLLMNKVNDVDVVLCSHCITMQYFEWLSSYELPLRFWISAMALPSVSQPFILQVRQFADARMFPTTHKLALQKIRMLTDTDLSIPQRDQGRLIV